jgi:hypothetical protein
MSQRRRGCVIRFVSLLEAYPPSSGRGEDRDKTGREHSADYRRTQKLSPL